MLAIDTNIVVRFLTGDDPDQSTKARDLIAGQNVLVTSTVLMETEWVLRSGYGLAREDVVEALRAFAGLPTVSIDTPDRAAKALDWASDGMDFADALHLAGASECEALVTFDRKFAKFAAAARGPSVRVL